MGSLQFRGTDPFDVLNTKLFRGNICDIIIYIAQGGRRKCEICTLQYTIPSNVVTAAVKI